MLIASLILSTIALICSLTSLTWLIAKQLSTHQIQMVPVDPFKSLGFENPLAGKMGKDPMEDFREIGTPIDEEQIVFEKPGSKQN